MTAIAKLMGLTTPVIINYDMMSGGNAVFTLTLAEDEVAETETTETKTVESIDDTKQEQASPLDKARAAAKLKREKKAAAIVARAAGKVKADEERTKADEEHQIVLEKERLLLEKKMELLFPLIGLRVRKQAFLSINVRIENYLVSMLKIKKSSIPRLKKSSKFTRKKT